MIIIKSVVEFGAKNWMPTILTEFYGASPEFTLFLSTIAMILNIPGMMFCNRIYDKLKGNEAKTVCIMFLIILPATLALLLLSRINIIIETIAFTLMGVIAYGASMTILVKYSASFEKLGLVSVIGGIMNALSAVGNFAAGYVCGFVADNFGWNTMITWWNILVIIAIIAAFLAIPIWNRFKINSKKKL